MCSQTHAKLTARALNEFIAFIHCEQSRSEVWKTPDHELIACMFRFKTHSLDEEIVVWQMLCQFIIAQSKYILKTTLFAQKIYRFMPSRDHDIEWSVSIQSHRRVSRTCRCCGSSWAWPLCSCLDVASKNPSCRVDRTEERYRPRLLGRPAPCPPHCGSSRASFGSPAGGIWKLQLKSDYFSCPRNHRATPKPNAAQNG